MHIPSIFEGSQIKEFGLWRATSALTRGFQREWPKSQFLFIFCWLNWLPYANFWNYWSTTPSFPCHHIRSGHEVLVICTWLCSSIILLLILLFYVTSIQCLPLHKNKSRNQFDRCIFAFQKGPLHWMEASIPNLLASPPIIPYLLLFVRIFSENTYVRFHLERVILILSLKIYLKCKTNRCVSVNLKKNQNYQDNIIT